mmetsp:Transcript_17768/g.50841  ORF Transcript_17768/g.50841 Transcript_17768/m.50841 type:complete len:222 (-) Transcript_17768:1583-2248(-)
MLCGLVLGCDTLSLNTLLLGFLLILLCLNLVSPGFGLCRLLFSAQSFLLQFAFLSGLLLGRYSLLFNVGLFCLLLSGIHSTTLGPLSPQTFFFLAFLLFSLNAFVALPLLFGHILASLLLVLAIGLEGFGVGPILFLSLVLLVTFHPLDHVSLSLFVNLRLDGAPFGIFLPSSSSLFTPALAFLVRYYALLFHCWCLHLIIMLLIARFFLQVRFGFILRLL